MFLTITLREICPGTWRATAHNEDIVDIIEAPSPGDACIGALQAQGLDGLQSYLKDLQRRTKIAEDELRLLKLDYNGLLQHAARLGQKSNELARAVESLSEFASFSALEEVKELTTPWHPKK